MNERTGDSEALFQKVVLGDLELDAPEVLAQRALDADFSQRLDEWSATASAIDRAREDQRSALALASTIPITDDDRELARRFVTGELARSPRRAVAPRWIAWAAALLILSSSAYWLADPFGRDDSRTGPLNVADEGAFPVGRVRVVERFVVPHVLPLGGRLTIEVVSRPPTGVADAPLRSPTLTSSRWELTTEQRRQLPARFVWSYEITDGSGEPYASGAYEVVVDEDERGR